ncbi:MAG: hypothetical protein WAM05_02645 [Candidatus Binataceae bacterium]
MNTLKLLVIVAVAGICCMVAAPRIEAQVSINIGPEPVCPYGYYDYAPYTCAPYGYYGPEWFRGREFVGAGPWFHGPKTFQGHVNNNFDPQHGYKGPSPKIGEKPEPAKRVDKVANFKGNEVRDGRGHVGGDKH